jgi:hypothetical protein
MRLPLEDLRRYKPVSFLDGYLPICCSSHSPSQLENLSKQQILVQLKLFDKELTQLSNVLITLAKNLILPTLTFVHSKNNINLAKQL